MNNLAKTMHEIAKMERGNNIKLRNCPFCDGKPEIISNDAAIHGFLAPTWAVICSMEDCIGHDIFPKYALRENAIEDWNRRPEPERGSEECQHHCGDGGCQADSCCHQSDIGECNKPTPTNNPLALAELREMDGEPVYLIVDDAIEALKMWALVSVGTDGNVTLSNNLGGSTEYCSDSGLREDGINAYRHPQKEDTKQ